MLKHGLNGVLEEEGLPFRLLRFRIDATLEVEPVLPPQSLGYLHLVLAPDESNFRPARTFHLYEPVEPHCWTPSVKGLDVVPGVHPEPAHGANAATLDLMARGAEALGLILQ